MSFISIARNLLKPKYVASATQIRTHLLFRPENPGLVFARDGIVESDEEFNQRYINYFSRPDIDGWEIRKGINDLQILDLVPEPKIIVEILKACRRVNDHSLAVRYLEAMYVKTGYEQKTFDWLMFELKPTIEELGISTPAELGYDKPELAMGDPERCSLVAKE